MKYADICVDIASPNLDKTFTYAVPDDMSVEIGTPVMVPFGSGNKTRKGYVVGLKSVKPDVDFEIKEIASTISKGLAIEDELVALAYRIKSNFGGMLKDALNVVIPVKQTVRKTTNPRHVDAFPEITKLIEEHPEGLEGELELNDEQQAASDVICQNFDKGDNKTYLLYGITGSGKTEVYIDVIRHVINSGKQVIMLIPEISLTYQTVKRFSLCFGNRVAFSHSKLSKGERYTQSENARNGLIDIMVGPRSALFTPFPNLGLIIVDEEHEASYKSEMPPKYHAREVALMRAEMAGASVILGSATPSIDSFKKALDGEYELLKLTKRALGAKLPESYIIDMREELKAGNRSVLSRTLQAKIQEKLDKKEQVMLFINRRGYAGFVSCRSCGHVPKCPHCDISLKLHKDGTLRCHYCGHVIKKPDKCPECRSPFILPFGTGTQKIEDLVTGAFPQAKVLRMDSDTTSKKGDFEKILSTFSKGKADILIGTQMIVKGHDFPNVTLVGILAADLSLYANDYRSGERTYELLSQASGRAGRGEKAGEVVIQTYNPEHYCIECASENRYEDFYYQEVGFRTLMQYPPCGNLMAIFVQSKKEEDAVKVSDRIVFATKDFSLKTGNKYKIIGPAPASVKKVNDVFRQVIYIKEIDYKNLVALKDALEYFIRTQDIKEATVQFDFNPLVGY